MAIWLETILETRASPLESLVRRSSSSTAAAYIKKPHRMASASMARPRLESGTKSPKPTWSGPGVGGRGQGQGRGSGVGVRVGVGVGVGVAGVRVGVRKSPKPTDVAETKMSHSAFA